ncbi:MAG: CHASE2 domain-containing protein [Chromatiales bacterium]|nr:CHASE2 domain-containing protein [Chromatiales bacterium]
MNQSPAASMPKGRSPAMVVAALALALLAAFAAWQGWLVRADRLLLDAANRQASRPAPDDIVIVAIDAESLQRLGRWPWSRALHAALVQRLTEAGARAVVFDVIFAEPDRYDPATDMLLENAIRANGRVLLPVLLEQTRDGGQLIETLPLPRLAEVAAALGHIHVELDADGIARSLYLHEGLGSPHWPWVGLALLDWLEPQRWDDPPGERRQLPVSNDFAVWERDLRVLIPFAGPPGHFQRHSYAAVLDGLVPDSALRDRIVLVGATATGLADALPTPLSGEGQPMPGVEIIANALDAVRSGVTITELSPAARAGLAALVVLVAFALYVWIPPRWGLAAALLVAGGIAVAATLTLAWSRVWIAPGAGLAGVLLSFPLWSGLRLSQAVEFLDEELQRLRDERATLPFAGLPEPAAAMQFALRAAGAPNWALHDAKGRPLAGSTGLTAAILPPRMSGVWLREGATLTVRVPESSGLLLTLERDDDEAVPAPVERLLFTAARLYDDAPGERRRTRIERMQARIDQIRTVAAAARELRAWVEDSIDQMPDGLIMTGAFGQVALMNRRARQVLGLDSDEAPGAALADLLVAAFPQSPEADWREAVDAALIEGRTSRLTTAAADASDLIVSIAPLQGAASDPNGQTGVLVNLADISALRAAERQRGEMLGFISHDMRSPLVSMLALVELARDPAEQKDVAQLLDRLEAQATRTLRLADQIVELRRAERLDDQALGVIDLAEVVNNALEQVWPQAEAREIRLRRELPDDPVWVRGDGALLERAFVNLLDNAVNYSPSGTEVVVRAGARDGRGFGSVADQGPGMDDETRARLFQRFARGAAAPARKHGGSGLGLAFVKTVADGHGGAVEVQTEPGAGTTFVLWLKLAKPD